MDVELRNPDDILLAKDGGGAIHHAYYIELVVTVVDLHPETIPGYIQASHILCRLPLWR